MTRAVAKLLVFDFRGYFELNVMALPTGIAALSMIHSDAAKGRAKVILICCSLIVLLANLIYYIVRLAVGAI